MTETPHRGLPAVVPVTPGDLDDVHHIAAASFPSAWSRETFGEELARDFAFLRGVRETDGPHLVSFIDFWIVRDEMHILNLATEPAWRRRGHARVLLEDALREARARQVRYATLEVRRSNEGAIRLYRGYGFAAIGIRPKYYSEDGEDALVMLLTMDPETGEVIPRPDDEDVR